MDIKKALLAFEQHRGNVMNPKKPKYDKAGNLVEFRLSFEQWLKIWLKSKHFEERGKQKGQYCMSRYNDLGHYEVGNVFIQLHSDNVSQAGKGHTRNKGVKRPPEVCERISKACMGRVGANRGRVWSQETRDKISASMKGNKNAIGGLT